MKKIILFSPRSLAEDSEGKTLSHEIKQIV